MADNTQLSAAVGSGDVVRDLDRASVKTQIVALDLNPAGSETLMAGKMPATVADGDDIAIGATTDAIVAAGATGSVSAKLRRATQGLEDLKTLIVLAAGTNNIGGVVAQPATSGGLSLSSFLSTSAVQATQVKGSAGQVYAIEFFNIGSAPVYVRLYNQTGAPAAGDTANIIWRGVVPGSATGAGVVKTWFHGLACSTGIGFRCTAAIADNDNTALTANEVIGNVEYK